MKGEEERVYNRAVLILALREHSVEELRRKLVRRNFPTKSIEVVLSRLVDTGILDDERFSEAFIREKTRHGLLGRNGLLLELKKRGVDGEVAAGAIESVWREEGIKEAELARDMLNRRAVCERRRAYGLLRRKGFSETTISEVMADWDGGP